LERQLADLKKLLVNGAHEPDWRSTVGAFAGDHVMMQIDEEARKIREADRKRARRKRTGGRSAER
jgi:hypothetical protein